MILKNLFLRNFRNFSQAQITLAPQINTICGANAQGKTSILEAIYFLSTGRSFRTSHIKDLIKEGENSFHIRAEFEKDSVSQTIEVIYDGVEKKIFHNQTKYSSLSSLLGLLPSVTYSPGDHELINGSPSSRRRFLNIHIAQYDPLYVHHLSRYYKALKYRNLLLRKKSFETISTWEEEMVKSAAYLIEKRHLMILDLQSIIPGYIHQLTNTGENASVRYSPSIPYNEDPKNIMDHFRHQLEHLRKKDTFLKNTTLGPHRDELLIYIDQKEARSFASEGQKRTFSLTLKLAAWDQLSKWMDEKVLFCVDDMGMQLDEKRKKLLTECLSKLPQTCITTPEDSSYFEKISSQVLFVKNGEISKESSPALL